MSTVQYVLLLILMPFSTCSNFVENSTDILPQIYIWDSYYGEFLSINNQTWAETAEDKNITRKIVNITSLHGRTINVAISPKFPYVFKDVETNETTGLLYDIWKLCEEYLKFKSNFTITARAKRMLKKNSVQVLLSDQILFNLRFKTYGYSSPYYNYDYKVIMKAPKIVPHSTYFFRSLQPEFWYACLGILTAFTLSLWSTVNILNKMHEDRRNPPIEHKLSVFTCFLMVSSGFLNQGSHYGFNSYSTRIQFFSSLLFGYAILSAVSASLIVQLSIATIVEPEDSAVGVSVPLCIPPNTTLYTYVENLNDSTYEVNSEKCPEGLENAEKSICVNESLLYEALPFIFRTVKLTNRWKCDTILLNTIAHDTNVIIFNKGFKEKQFINSFIERIRTSGILKRLIGKWIDLQPVKFTMPKFKVVTFLHVQNTLIGYFGAVALSSFLLLMEILYFKIKMRIFNESC